MLNRNKHGGLTGKLFLKIKVRDIRRSLMMSLTTHPNLWAGQKVRPSRGQSQREQRNQQKPKIPPRNTRTEKNR